MVLLLIIIKYMSSKNTIVIKYDSKINCTFLIIVTFLLVRNLFYSQRGKRIGQDSSVIQAFLLVCASIKDTGTEAL